MGSPRRDKLDRKLKRKIREEEGKEIGEENIQKYGEKDMGTVWIHPVHMASSFSPFFYGLLASAVAPIWNVERAMTSGLSCGAT